MILYGFLDISLKRFETSIILYRGECGHRAFAWPPFVCFSEIADSHILQLPRFFRVWFAAGDSSGSANQATVQTGNPRLGLGALDMSAHCVGYVEALQRRLSTLWKRHKSPLQAASFTRTCATCGKPRANLHGAPPQRPLNLQR